MITQKTIVIFGANGFIGSEITRVLAGEGYRLKLAHRYPKACDYLKVNGAIGQIVPVPCDFTYESIEDVTKDASIAINAIGILAESRKRTFKNTHAELPENIARACKKNKVDHLVHISALGIDKAKSKYAKSKHDGEELVIKSFKNTTILRPSIVFGPKDSFFNRFAGLARLLPALPLIGGGNTKFQPVYVGDVAKAVSYVIKQNCYNTYQLGGPEIYSFKELMEIVKHYTGARAALIPIPFFIAKVQGAFLQHIPGKPLTVDQVKTLKTNNIVQKNAMQMSDLGIKPTSVHAIVPTYLGKK